MNEISRYFSAMVASAGGNAAPAALDTLMQQQLRARPPGDSPAFNHSSNAADKEQAGKKALEQFLQHYQQAVDGGKFILAYSSDEAVKGRQFSADLQLLYQLMEPPEGCELRSPSMKARENWLIALLSPVADEDSQDKGTPASVFSDTKEDGDTEVHLSDEKAFLNRAFNSFLAVYKKNYEDLIEKTKEEMQKPLTVDWE